MNWAVETPVKLGRRTGTLVEIKQGLKEGDKVIGKFDQNLRAGSKASIKNKRFALFMEQPLIVVQNLSKSFRRDSLEIPVLRNVSLQVARGEFVAFMGPSGSGKTTFLNLIAGIDKPSEGRIVIAGVDVTELTETQLAAWRSQNVGFIFQFYNLIPVLTAVENVELPLILTPLSKKARRAHAETALEVVGLADLMHHYPRQLSGGQEQRVAIARAIVTDPVILVADEPTGDLDKVSTEQVLNLMDRLNRELNTTILMVTHDPRAAERARSVRHLEKGELA
jgi:putative ABC transport system ATP-binding protein